MNRKIFGDFNIQCCIETSSNLNLVNNFFFIHKDMIRIDYFKMVPIIFLTVFLGIYPNFLLVFSENYVLGYILYAEWL